MGVAGLGVSLAGAATRVLPRQFTAKQQRQILDWEAGKAWRVTPASKIFPGTVTYQPPSELNGSPLLAATMIGIARQATCRAATDPAVAAVLDRNGCQAVLRATYADATDSYVVTVGVAAFPGTAAASAAHRELAGVAGNGGGARGKAASVAAGVRPVAFTGTPAAWFTSGRRQISSSITKQTYIVFYTIGYADDRPREPVASDSYAYSEMSSLGAGVAHHVLSTLAKRLPQPHCPGTPGC